mgnify:CR=1 FL=1
MPSPEISFFPLLSSLRIKEDFKDILREGADKVAVNTAAIMNPELISRAADKFGSQCVVVAIDARRRADGSGWNVYKNGGRIDTGLDAVEWAIQAHKLGAGEILLTSMDCDGTKAGYDLDITRLIAENVSIPVIASGGAGKMEHFADALEHAVLRTIEEGEMTGDLALITSLSHVKKLSSQEFISAVRMRLHCLLRLKQRSLMR